MGNDWEAYYEKLRERERKDRETAFGPPFFMRCHQCGSSFTAKKSWAKYCSGKCRVYAHRTKNTAEKSA